MDLRTTHVSDSSIAGMLRWNSVVHGDKTAVICGGRSLTYSELESRSNRLSNGLAEMGLRRGDRCAIWLPNCLQYVELYYALAKASVAAVPINPQLTADEAAYIINDSASKALFVHSAFREDIERLRGSRVVALAAERVIVVDDPRSYEAILADSRSDPPAVEVAAEDCFYQGYTSGTTGSPKGCVNPHWGFVDHFKRAALAFRTTADDRMIIPTPLFHEAPALFSLQQLFLGGTVIVMPSFTVDGFLATVESERATVAGFVVPTMLDRISQYEARDRYDVTSLKRIIVAGAPLFAATREASLDYFRDAKLHEFYGATEVGCVTSIVHSADGEKSTSVGKPMYGMNVVVLDDDGNEVPQGEIGEIFITPVMLREYYNKPDETEQSIRVFDGVRWLSVGDVGYKDADGYLYVTDRKTHMIITGGENVYPVEVENVLAQHPDVQDVAVIGLPDREWGERITAVLEVAPDSEGVDEQAVIEFCRAKLSGYKVPRRVVVVDEIPRNPSGKVLKHVLRDQLA